MNSKLHSARNDFESLGQGIEFLSLQDVINGHFMHTVDM